MHSVAFQQIAASLLVICVKLQKKKIIFLATLIIFAKRPQSSVVKCSLHFVCQVELRKTGINITSFRFVSAELACQSVLLRLLQNQQQCITTTTYIESVLSAYVVRCLQYARLGFFGFWQWTKQKYASYPVLLLPSPGNAALAAAALSKLSSISLWSVTFRQFEQAVTL